MTDPWTDDASFYSDDARRRDNDEREQTEHRQERETDRWRERTGSFTVPDPRPAKRIRLETDGWKLLREQMQPAVSQLSGNPAHSLHHIVPRSLGGSDVRENLMWVTGTGTTGEHGAIEGRDPAVLAAVREALTDEQAAYCLRVLGADRLARMYPLLGERAA